MKPSESLYRTVKQFEGYRLEAYKDSAGVPTIGFGTIMYPDGKRVKMGDTITPVYADACLRWEVDNKTKSVAAFVSNVVLTQNQFDALVSFAYNLGVGALQKSTLLKKVIKDPNDTTIRDEFMKWNKVTDPVTKNKIPVRGLTRRRQAEADLYFS